MRKIVQIIVATILLGSLTFQIQADPFKTWHWTPPTVYENNTPIPAGDLRNYRLHCSNNSGGPYEASRLFDPQVPPSLEDMAFIVAGLPGTYYCVATVDSFDHSTTSGYSNEVSFPVAPETLGLVPKPPILSLQ